MKFLEVDKVDVPYSIQHLRDLVDSYNSYANRLLTNELLDEMLIAYSDIRLHYFKFRNDSDLFIEISDNHGRYSIKKYSFVNKSGIEKLE